MLIFIRKGFTIIELMIVLAIIAIAMSIAVPNFMHMSSVSKRTVCISNLRHITEAIEQWAIDKSISSGVNISQEQEDYIYSNYLHSGKPKCPSGGDYLLNPVSSNPQVQCTREEAEGHKL